MDERLKNLYVTLVESPSAKYFAASDGDIEGLCELKDSGLNAVQNAVNGALKAYKEKVVARTSPTTASSFDKIEE